MRSVLLCAVALCASLLPAQELHLRLASSLPGTRHVVPAVAWLEPMASTVAPPFTPHGRYVLLQKNRTFSPHLQVIPVGSVVQFPNADPFFHNVFSLFDGRRFDLGLYEAGSSKSVNFPREGVSYIFCNIHPEMSAVVVSLSTPLYAIADREDAFALQGIPAGDYELHLWAEGVPQRDLNALTRKLHLGAGLTDLGVIKAPIARGSGGHTNQFGHAYEAPSDGVY